MALFDLYGWYTEDIKWQSRVASTLPTKIPKKKTVGANYPNWSGHVWVDLPYEVPPAEVVEETTVQSVDPVLKPQQKITTLAFLNRFADAEAIALDLASIGATQDAAAIRRYVSKVNAATFIDLQDQQTRNGILALISAGLLTQARATEILDTLPTAAEKY